MYKDMALKYPELFQPFKIGKVEIKNKIVMSGMHNIGWTDENDLIDDCVIDYFEARAKGGVGLIFTGAQQPDYQLDNGVIMKNPFQNSSTFISRHKKLVDRVHAYGAKIFIQFAYGGGRVDFPAWIPGQGIAPSDCPNRWDPSIQHRAITKDEIHRIIDASISAAVICQATGCDGIDINCYGGYTTDQFLQPCFNKRTDEYGGLDGGIRLMREIMLGIKERCGKDFPVTCRLGMRQHIKAVGQGGLEGEDYVEYGRTPEQSIYVAKKLAEAGYDAIYLGNGTYDSFYWLYPPMYQKEGLWLDDVKALTEQIDVPVICGGKILQPQMANDAIKDGKVTAVVLGRQLLADPEWPNKARLGLDDAIRPCIGCNFGCIGHIFAGLPQMCAVNANLMREKDMDVLQPANPVKKVAIIGGGVAGMECARIAAKRGHKVTIYDKGDKLGGTFLAASVAKCKDAERRLLKWFERELAEAGVEIRLNTELDMSATEALDCDEIVVSTGNRPKLPPIKGIDGKNVYSPVKVLLGEEKLPENGKVVIVGGGLVGCEVAVWLREEMGFADVTLVEGADELMAGGYEPMPLPNKLMLIDLLKFHGVKVMLRTMLDAVDPDGVTVKQNGKTQKLNADAVILALGFNANDKLYRELNANLPKKVWLLGDAKMPSNIMFGIRDANAVARAL